MNYYQNKRRVEIRSLLDPSATSDELVEALSAYVEAETRKAYGRGFHDRDKRSTMPTSNSGNRYEVHGKPTALQAGKIKRVQK